MLKFYLITGLYFAIVLTCSFLLSIDALLLFIINLICLLLYMSISAWGAACINSQMYVRTYCSNSLAAGKVAITFDDGPDPENTPKLLDLLKQYNAKCTFFLIGNNITKYNEIAKRIFNEGHSIGNHSYYHGNLFPLKLPSSIKKEIQSTQTEIDLLTDFGSNYFRPPFGITNPLIAFALSKLNLKVIGWSIRSFDTTNRSKEKILERITKQIKAGDIILLHDKAKYSYWLTKELLDYLKLNNLQAVTVDELLVVKKMT